MPDFSGENLNTNLLTKLPPLSECNERRWGRVHADISSGSVSDMNSGKYKLIRFLGDMDEDGIIKASDASAILSAYADISAGSEQ